MKVLVYFNSFKIFIDDFFHGLADHWMKGVVLLFILYILRTIFIYLYNNIDFEIKIKLSLDQIVKAISFISKNEAIKLYFNNRKQPDFVLPFFDKNGLKGNKKIKGNNLIRNLKIDLDPSYDFNMLSKSKLDIGQLYFSNGPITVNYYIKVYPDNKIIEVLFNNEEVNKINQKNIQHRYLLSFDHQSEKMFLGKINVFSKINKIIFYNSKNRNIKNILISYIRTENKGVLEKNINEILETIIQPSK